MFNNSALAGSLSGMAGDAEEEISAQQAPKMSKNSMHFLSDDKTVREVTALSRF